MDSSAWLKAGEVIFGGALGGTAAVFGLSRWLGEVWLGRILEKEKAKYAREIEKLRAGFAQELEHYRAQLDRSTFVTRAHFEVELDAYKKVFEGLGEIRLAIQRTRPLMEVMTGPQPNQEERVANLVERLNDLANAQNKTVLVIERLSPFYPRDIYLKLEPCLAVVRREILDIKTSGDTMLSSDWYDKGQQRLDAFFPLYNGVTEAIRERIAALAIIPR
jgi:hypothetical protein